MLVNVFLLMLTPTIEENFPSYSFISSYSDTPTIPSVELQTNFNNMNNVLESIVEYHVGSPSFDTNFILYDVFLSEGLLNIYYYIFLPPGLKTKHGYFTDIEEIKHIQSYHKLVNKSKDEKETQENITGSVVFDLIDNKEIRIRCYLPDIQNLSEDDVIKYSENYAHMLTSITDGLYSQQIADILLKGVSKDDPKEVLFINNIISFWSFFHVENYKKITKYVNQPLVRPSKVFKKP